ncbi:collagen-like protein, partial [Pedobacter sp. AK013]|uniref:collagen-like triple helix repeat-containing protein n=1 Tax=Pedobacter sp. AK013 TaxID=2723071 RepID=UPI001C872B62
MKKELHFQLFSEKTRAQNKRGSLLDHLVYCFINTIRKIIWIGLIFGFPTLAFAQQKVKDGSVGGSNLPNKDAILELESANKGILHVRVALRLTTDAFPLSAHVAGMMVYNTATANDVVPGIYYNDGTKWVFVRSSNAILVENQPGKTGAPGIPGATGGPGTGVTIVTNDSGTWVYNPTTHSWTNINGAKGDKGDKGDAGVVGVQGMPGTSGSPGTPGSGTAGAPGAG